MERRVAVQRCETYDETAVKARLAQCFADIGGLERYINKGERVLLKVNLVMKKRPEEAATTHPVVVKALAQLLLEYGAKVLIGDSPGGLFSESILRGLYAATGMERVAAETGASLNFNVKAAERANPNGVLLKKLTTVDMLNDVDKVISVSKLKTHGMMTFTGAVKNMFGIVPGVTKAEYHLNMPSYDMFANALIDVCLCAPPVLSVMDGIEAMEGHGPTSGRARPMNALLAANDPFALDQTACAMIGLAEARVPILAEGIKRGLCTAGLGYIQYFGEPWKAFEVDDFDIPETRTLLTIKPMPKFFRRFMGRFLQPKPVFVHETCVGCGDCARNCPAKVIEMRAHKPFAAMNACIRCFCCQELCPKKAVEIYRPRLLRILSRRGRVR